VSSRYGRRYGFCLLLCTPKPTGEPFSAREILVAAHALDFPVMYTIGGWQVQDGAGTKIDLLENRFRVWNHSQGWHFM